MLHLLIVWVLPNIKVDPIQIAIFCHNLWISLGARMCLKLSFSDSTARQMWVIYGRRLILICWLFLLLLDWPLTANVIHVTCKGVERWIITMALGHCLRLRFCLSTHIYILWQRKQNLLHLIVCPRLLWTTTKILLFVLVSHPTEKKTQKQFTSHRMLPMHTNTERA